MKKLLEILLLVPFIFFSCNSKTKKKTKQIKPIPSEILIPNERIDTSKIEKEKEIKIRTSKIKNHAQQILENKIEPSDDNETFECINQLFIENQSDLNFYFDVFRVILQKSDGALSEVTGLYVMEFLTLYPDFFIDKYSRFESEEKNNFIAAMSFEFYMAEPNHMEKIDTYFSNVRSKIKMRTDSKLEVLDEIKKMAIVNTERIVNY